MLGLWQSRREHGHLEDSSQAKAEQIIPKLREVPAWGTLETQRQDSLMRVGAYVEEPETSNVFV